MYVYVKMGWNQYGVILLNQTSMFLFHRSSSKYYLR